MNSHIAFRLCLVCVAALPGLTFAQSPPVGAVVRSAELNWAEKMFGDKVPQTGHDFGVVAKGAKTVHELKFKNLYKETVVVQSVTPGCSCIKVRPLKLVLQSNEESALEIELDTTNYQRQRDTSIKVVFSAPFYKEVTIPVRGYIRTDVVLTPSEATFGVIEQGAKAEKKLMIAYAGRPDWKVEEVRTQNAGVTAAIREISRIGGSISYELLVTVPADRPLGAIREQLLLVTNDQNSPTVPVAVSGKVEADITITPETVSFDAVAPGQTQTKTVVIRSKKPFSIADVECESELGAFRMKCPKDEKVLHTLPLSFKAVDGMEGTITEQFYVTIPGRPQPVTFRARVNISGTPPSSQVKSQMPAASEAMVQSEFGTLVNQHKAAKPVNDLPLAGQ